MAFSPENLKIWVNSREIHAFIQTATYPPFTKGTIRRCTHKAVHTEGISHTRRSSAHTRRAAATARVMLFKGPQARRYTHKAVHTQGGTH